MPRSTRRIPRTYPCPVDQLNLRMILNLKATYPECPIGYAGELPQIQKLRRVKTWPLDRAPDMV